MIKYYKLIYISLSIFILIFLLYLLYYKINNKKCNFPHVPLMDINGNKIANIYCGKYISLIFSPTDCSICLDEITTVLNKYEDSNSKNIKIIGIINSKDPQAVSKIKDNYEIHFELFRDSSFATKNFFSKSSQYSSKPILIQLSNGKIIKKCILGDPKDYHEIEQILTYLKKGN